MVTKSKVADVRNWGSVSGPQDMTDADPGTRRESKSEAQAHIDMQLAAVAGRHYDYTASALRERDKALERAVARSKLYDWLIHGIYAAVAVSACWWLVLRVSTVTLR